MSLLMIKILAKKILSIFLTDLYCGKILVAGQVFLRTAPYDRPKEEFFAILEQRGQ